MCQGLHCLEPFDAFHLYVTSVLAIIKLAANTPHGAVPATKNHSGNCHSVRETGSPKRVSAYLTNYTVILAPETGFLITSSPSS